MPFRESPTQRPGSAAKANTKTDKLVCDGTPLVTLKIKERSRNVIENKG
jgi:hypothetical protein